MSTDATVRDILEKSIAGERLTPSNAVTLLESHDLAAIGSAADQVARRHRRAAPMDMSLAPATFYRVSRSGISRTRTRQP